MKVFDKKNKHVITFAFILINFSTSCFVYAQDSITMDVKEIQAQSEAVNRTVTFNNQEIYLTAQGSNGFLRIKGINFKEGIIEADIKGSNTPQRSFVGIAFHGGDDETYEAVYFRPFNFKNPERKSHSVQYIAHPTFTWDKLRNEHPGTYEAALNLDLNPDDWFHVRIQVKETRVDVYINDVQVPTLSINRLSKDETGWLGFWTGYLSDGWFRNIKLTSITK
ncbi:family 16 glycoside hydrolase [Olivibacter sp. CPCC 100613]|uniref:family 16 glycoside hydrolase n=1 Tax=Olivibacter sp. CPCC 100613 TaxID=3079931 RepID=UPI002FFB68AE